MMDRQIVLRRLIAALGEAGSDEMMIINKADGRTLLGGWFDLDRVADAMIRLFEEPAPDVESQARRAGL